MTHGINDIWSYTSARSVPSIKAALIRPHAVNLADTIVDIRVDSKEGLCSVTFGLRNQIGGLDPATTVFMPFSAFKALQEELAKKLQALD